MYATHRVIYTASMVFFPNGTENHQFEMLAANSILNDRRQLCDPRQ